MTKNKAISVNYNYSMSYNIEYIENLFDQYEKNNILEHTASEKCSTNRRIIVIDTKVHNLYINKIKQYFIQKDICTEFIKISCDEKNKSFNNYKYLLNQFDTFQINRRSEPIIALGGGVLTDLVGFASGTYRRGVPHIKIPTTLMGYVDASVGIKTGINFNNNKNRIGAFVQPLKVILDRSFFTTLHKRHILNGVGEIIKLGIINDLHLFNLLENFGEESIKLKFQDDKSLEILERSINTMIKELEPDLIENNLERKVDFGHTFSPVLEMNHNDLLHGEAVAIDCIYSCFLSYHRRYITKNELYRIIDLATRLKILKSITLNNHELWNSLKERVVHRGGLQRIPLPSSIGSCIFSNDITEEEILNACNQYNQIVN